MTKDGIHMLATTGRADGQHFGFCMALYDMETCNDCPDEIACLDLFILEEEALNNGR